MTRSKILRAAAVWPMYPHELGGDILRLTWLEVDGRLCSYLCSDGKSRMYQTTPKGKAWLKLPWWRRLWS